MSQIVWVLYLTTLGAYGSTNVVGVEFKTEQMCEEARATVIGIPYKTECKPMKVQK